MDLKGKVLVTGQVRLAETIEWFRNKENLAQYKADIYNV